MKKFVSIVASMALIMALFVFSVSAAVPEDGDILSNAGGTSEIKDATAAGVPVVLGTGFDYTEPVHPHARLNSLEQFDLDGAGIKLTGITTGNNGNEGIVVAYVINADGWVGDGWSFSYAPATGAVRIWADGVADVAEITKTLATKGDTVSAYLSKKDDATWLLNLNGEDIEVPKAYFEVSRGGKSLAGEDYLGYFSLSGNFDATGGVEAVVADLGQYDSNPYAGETPAPTEADDDTDATTAAPGDTATTAGGDKPPVTSDAQIPVIVSVVLVASLAVLLVSKKAKQK